MHGIQIPIVIAGILTNLEFKIRIWHTEKQFEIRHVFKTKKCKIMIHAFYW